MSLTASAANDLDRTRFFIDGDWVGPPATTLTP